MMASAHNILRNTRRAFTLVELLVVISIIVILIAILIPVFSRAREQAKASATSSFINTIVVAIEAYRSDMARYPTSAAPNGAMDTTCSNYGFNALAQGLIGYKSAAGGWEDGSWSNNPGGWWGDGADGPGFRLSTSKSGRVYGPYLRPTPKNYRVFAQASDMINPVPPSGGSASTDASKNFGREWGSGSDGRYGINQGFIDAWGQPIFYWPAASAELRAFDDPGKNARLLFSSATVKETVFPSVSPDADARVYYTIKGRNIYSLLVPYTPADKWNIDTTPWGAGTAVTTHYTQAGDAGASYTGAGTYAAPYDQGIVGVRFRALLGSSNPGSRAVAFTDRIIGQSSYLLVSAGKDNQYFTGDEILNEYAK